MRFKTALIFISAFSAAGLSFHTPGQAEVLTPERVFSAPDISGPVARGVKLSPDGTLVTFLKPKANDRSVLDLWIMPVNQQAAARLLVDSTHFRASSQGLSEQEAARRERQRVFDSGIIEYAWNSQGSQILIPITGELFTVDVKSGTVTKRVSSRSPSSQATDAKFSPRGNYLSFVSEGEVVITPISENTRTRISPMAKDGITYGVAEFVAQEEFARDTGYWWSPDEASIAYTKVDESRIETVTRVEIGTSGAELVSQRYPRAGTENAQVDLYVKKLDQDRSVKVDLGANPDIYLARVHWSPDGKILFAQLQSRDQQTLHLIRVDPASGKSETILTEEQSPWINLALDFWPLERGGFLWTSERTGYRHLYHYGSNGKLLRAVTSGDFPLASLDRQPGLIGVDEESGIAYILASRDSAIERHLYSVDYRKGGALRQLTKSAGWWTASMGQHNNVFIGSFSNYETPPQTAVYDTQGTLQRWIEENPLDATHPYWPYKATQPNAEFGQLTAEDGQKLDYILLTPTGFDPKKTYPAIIRVYGGPGRQKVSKAWRPVEERLFLEAGYVVMQLDNRGAANRGYRFAAAIHKRLGTPEVADQLTGLRYLQGLPFVDGNRVGVTGWSYGGFMTMRLLTEPGADFAAGAAGALPAFWNLYDTHYTERYLGMPQDEPEVYEASSILPRLPQLRGRLLLMHGMADDNVLFENATQVMNRLQELGITFDLMLYPGQRHGIVGERKKLQQWRTYLEFFERTLKSTQ